MRMKFRNASQTGTEEEEWLVLGEPPALEEPCRWERRKAQRMLA
jgi:hypothetical protein